MNVCKLYFVCSLLAAIIVIGCVFGCMQWNVAQPTNNTVQTKDDNTTIEVTTKIETETDEEGYTERATKPIETEAEIETETEIETNITVEPPFYLSEYERWIAECIVMGESGCESYEGQILVAQCLLNACLKDDIQPSVVRTKYKYSGWHNSPTDSVKSAVSAVFDEGYRLTDEFILYFYAPKYVSGKWHETQRFIIEVGGHRFFAEWDK